MKDSMMDHVGRVTITLVIICLVCAISTLIFSVINKSTDRTLIIDGKNYRTIGNYRIDDGTVRFTAEDGRKFSLRFKKVIEIKEQK